MINDYFAKAIIDITIFLEFSGQETLDEDAGIDALETLAANLQNMPENDKIVLISSIRALADKYGARSGFVENLPQMLGLD